MLDTLRKSAGGIVGFFLIGLLVIAFALWGIADTFTGFSNTVLARVGDKEIERVEYQLRFSQQLEQMASQLGTSLNVTQAKSLDLDLQVLNTMLGSAALRNAAQDLGLAYSDAVIAQAIIEDAHFAGLNGEFDQPTFHRVLNQSGLTEDLFVADQRDFHIRKQFTDASINKALVPQIMIEKLYKHFLERRIVKYLIVTLDTTNEVGEPTNEELEAFYNETSLRFTEPERRTASVLVVSPSRFSQTIHLADDILRDEYNLSIDEFTKPEIRTINQLVLADETAAEEIHQLIRDGAKFVEIVNAAGQNLDNTDLGMVKRDDLISPELADKAFSMQLGAVSDVIEGPLGHVVLRVRDIKPGAVKPFKEVRQILHDRLVHERAIEDIAAFSETVEDERAAGVTFEEIGQRFDLDVIELGSFDNEGRLAGGQPTPLLDRYQDLTRNLFDIAINQDIPMLETSDGSFIWASLKSIQPESVRPLDEVRDHVIAQWQINERGKLLEAMAEHMVKTGNTTGDFRQVSAGFNRRPLTSGPMTRQTSNDTFPEAAIEKIFAIEKNKFAWAPVGFGSELMVMQIVDVIDAEVKENGAKELIFGGEMRKYRADLVNQFVTSLTNIYGVKIYDDNVEQAINQLAVQ